MFTRWTEEEGPGEVKTEEGEARVPGGKLEPRRPTAGTARAKSVEKSGTTRTGKHLSWIQH